jgi:ABC-type multidrug transport system fused ATPase/permease subunit
MKTQAEQEIIAYNKKFQEIQRKCFWWLKNVGLPLTLLAGIIAFIAFSFMANMNILPTAILRVEFVWVFVVISAFTPIVIVFYLCSRHCRKEGLIPCKPKKYIAPKKQSKIEALYENNLKPKLEVLEKQRKIIHSRLTFWKRAFFLLTIGIWAVLLMSIIDSLHGDDRITAIFFVILIPPVVSIVIYSIISRKITKPYRKKFKAEIINPIVATVDESLTYYPQKNISFRDFMASGLFYAERVDGEDYVEGMLGNTAARFSELRATYTVETEEGAETVTSYSGLFFVFDFNKAFEGRTVVIPQESRNNNYGQLVRLESPEFEKAFAVYSDDQITARYILSLSLMQRILSFSLQHRAIYLSFVNGILYVGIPSWGSSVVMGKVILPFFEPKISSTLLDFKHYRKEFIYLSFVKDIVEEFNLNRRIWSKGAPLPVFSQDNLKKMISG